MTDETPAGIRVPDDLPDDDEDVYLLGVAHCARRFGVTATTLEDEIQARLAGDDACPECGGEIVEDFGGARCADCGYTLQETDRE